MSVDRTLKALKDVLLKAFDEMGLDEETSIKCKELLEEIVEKASTVKEEGGNRKSIREAVFDLLNEKAGTVDAT